MSHLSYAVSSVVGRLTSPLKAARFERQARPFLHRGKRGLLFELYPGEEIDRHIATYGIYEDRLLRYLHHILPEGAVMLDIGANIGNHALFLSDKCSAIHCFEPNPETYQRLEKNIALNVASNISVHRFGLGDKDCIAHFQANHSGNLGASGFVNGDRPAEGHELLELPIRNADEVVSELKLDRIDFIKIDIEGMEAKLFPALKRTIAHYRPLIAFEFSGHISSPNEWRKIRDSLPGYTIVEPKFSTLQSLKTGGMPIFEEVQTPDKRWYESLIATPVER